MKQPKSLTADMPTNDAMILSLIASHPEATQEEIDALVSRIRTSGALVVAGALLKKQMPRLRSWARLNAIAR